MPLTLSTAFEKLDMHSGDGLLSVNEINSKKKLHPRARRILIEAAEFGASHVYFRRYANDDRPPKPQAFIFDLTGRMSSDWDLAEAHRKLWNYGTVPLMYVVRSDRVDIYNLLQKPVVDDQGQAEEPTAVDKLSLGGKVAKAITDSKWKRFSGRALDNGTFWDDPRNRVLITRAKSAQDTLLKEIREVRISFEKEQVLEPDLTRRFLILCLMVKFLEDRHILRAGFFGDFHIDAKDFSGLLRKGRNAALLMCLARLAQDFNGDVFVLSPDDRAKLEKTDLSRFADFVEGKVGKRQLHLWRLYSFEYLPVELISYIYEDFLKENKGAVYTPHLLVELLLDESMPLEKLKDDFKVLDPACGSGVFLVGAFRRLVEAWKHRNQKAWEAMTPRKRGEKLCTLLQDNIWGRDIDKNAVELTVFSLCLALCSEMPAAEVLNNLRFPPLKQKNISDKDFFEVTLHADEKSGSYDLIIGNPPFGSEVEKNHPLEAPDKRKGPVCDYPPLPDRQLCYLFLREAPKLLKEDGLGCFLQKDGFLYNGGVLDFRRAFFENRDVPQILDFVSIRGLFKGRKKKKDEEKEEVNESKDQTVDVKTVAVFFRKVAPDSEKPLLHATFRKLFTVEGSLAFELDTYDFNLVPRDIACREQNIWKANLLGGERLLATYNILTNGRNVEGFLKKHRKDWVWSEGFITATSGTIEEPLLTGKPCLETQGLTTKGINLEKIYQLTAEKFTRTRDLRIYQPPHLLIKEHESLPVAYRSKEMGWLSFKDKIVGIACLEDDGDQLQELGTFFQKSKRDLHFFLAFSAQYLVNRTSAILKEDIMRLPYPESGEIRFRGVEPILRDELLDLQIPFIKRGAKTSPLAKEVTETQLQQFSSQFIRVISTAYPQAKVGEQYELDTAWCSSFYFGDKPKVKFGDPKELEAHLESLLQSQHSPSLRIQRVVRLFDRNCLFFIKPKAFRFWTRSIAIRDADEVFSELRRQRV